MAAVRSGASVLFLTHEVLRRRDAGIRHARPLVVARPQPTHGRFLHVFDDDVQVGQRPSETPVRSSYSDWLLLQAWTRGLGCVQLRRLDAEVAGDPGAKPAAKRRQALHTIELQSLSGDAFMVGLAAGNHCAIGD